MNYKDRNNPYKSKEDKSNPYASKLVYDDKDSTTISSEDANENLKKKHSLVKKIVVFVGVAFGLSASSFIINNISDEDEITYIEIQENDERYAVEQELGNSDDSLEVVEEKITVTEAHVPSISQLTDLLTIEKYNGVNNFYSNNNSNKNVVIQNVIGQGIRKRIEAVSNLSNIDKNSSQTEHQMFEYQIPELPTLPVPESDENINSNQTFTMIKRKKYTR